MGGKQKANNKMVRKQFQYDKDLWKFQNRANEQRYEDALTVRDRNIDNNRAAIDYRNQTALQNWQYQQDLQRQEYRVQKKAYQQSLRDYDTQTEYNSMAAAVAREAENRKLEEALIQKNFSLGDANIGMARARSERNFQNAEFGRQRQTAKAQTRLEKQSNELSKQFARDSTKYQNEAARNQFDELRQDVNLQKESINADRAFIKEDTKAQKVISRLNRTHRKEDTTLQQEISKFQREELGADIGKQIGSLNEKNKQLNRDIFLTGMNKTWDGQDIDTKYDRTQAENMHSRMTAMAEKTRALGIARAAGREGATAESTQQSILAEYARSQAQLVDSLVFSGREQDTASARNIGTKAHKARSLVSQNTLNNVEKLRLRSKEKYFNKISGVGDQRLDKSRDLFVQTSLEQDKRLDLSKTRDLTKTRIQKSRLDVKKEFARKRRDNQINQNNLKRDFDIDKLNNANSKLDLALANTQQQITNNANRVWNEFGFKKSEYNLSKDKISATYDSAKQAKFAADSSIALDEYAANIAAQSKVMSRPKYPKALPVPLATPKTLYPKPTAPEKPPKPIKGSISKPSVWDTVGQVANVGLTIAGLF